MLEVGVTITEFIHHLKAVGYAPNTVTSYIGNIRHFKRYLHAQGISDLRQVNFDVLYAYQQKVMAESIAGESKALKLRPVKRLFEHLTDTHRLLINPAEGLVETSRKNKKLPPVLTMQEIQRLFAQPNLSFNGQIRNRAIMQVLYATGIRLEELLRLKVYHADLREKVLYIKKGKGRKQRIVPLGQAAAGQLNEYLKHVRPVFARQRRTERALFLNRYGEPIKGGNIRLFLRRYRQSAGIQKPVSPHGFRRACATHLLQQGADIRHIQKLLGHRRLSTTQAYTRVMPVQVKKTHARTHPEIIREKGALP